MKELHVARLGAVEGTLRAEVRSFLEERLPPGSYRPGLGMNASHSPAFSRELAARGWVGMSIPPEYGGHGGTAVERFVVIEELLAAGAPIAAHWIADRQTAPMLLAFGTEQQRRQFLPTIARGECFFSIGLSEPDAGSDLASIRTVAVKVDRGWLLNGTKVWTSNAHKNQWFVVLCRTQPVDADRHQGLSQMIVDLSSPGVSVRPITLLDGSDDFNEVALHDVFVPADMLLGEEGSGWQQVTSELAYERAGPDRFMTTYPLYDGFVRELMEKGATAEAEEAVGGMTARYWMIRQLSLAVAQAIDESEAPLIQAAVVKDLGTIFEQQVVATIRGLLELDPDPTSGEVFESLLAEATLISPSYTIRGGTTEVLRSVAAKALRERP